LIGNFLNMAAFAVRLVGRSNLHRIAAPQPRTTALNAFFQQATCLSNRCLQHLKLSGIQPESNFSGFGLQVLSTPTPRLGPSGSSAAFTLI